MRKANLLLHCGAHAASLADVRVCPTPRGTDTFIPIPHFTLYDMVRDRLPRGFDVVHEAHAISHGGARYFALLQVEDPSSDYGLVLGLRNSHDHRFPAGVCLGSQVFVCDNLAFNADIVLRRKHTKYLFRDLPGMIDETLISLVEIRANLRQRVIAYQNTHVTEVQMDHFLIQTIRKGAVPPSKLGLILKEIENPRHLEHARFGRDSVWNVYNAITEHMKPPTSSKGESDHLFTLPRRSMLLHALLDDLCA